MKHRYRLEILSTFTREEFRNTGPTPADGYWQRANDQFRVQDDFVVDVDGLTEMAALLGRIQDAAREARVNETD